MSLEKTIQELKDLLNRCTSDLQKTERGNRAAAQRVRTGSVKLEKVAKRFRKESVAEEKSGSFRKYKEAHKKNLRGKKSPKRAAAKPAKRAAASRKNRPAKKKITMRKIALRRPANRKPQRRLGL